MAQFFVPSKETAAKLIAANRWPKRVGWRSPWVTTYWSLVGVVIGCTENEQRRRLRARKEVHKRQSATADGFRENAWSNWSTTITITRRIKKMSMAVRTGNTTPVPARHIKGVRTMNMRNLNKKKFNETFFKSKLFLFYCLFVIVASCWIAFLKIVHYWIRYVDYLDYYTLDLFFVSESFCCAFFAFVLIRLTYSFVQKGFIFLMVVFWWSFIPKIKNYLFIRMHKN